MMRQALRRLARRLRHDQRGVAAIEFALLAPILVGLYLGSVELVLAFQAQQRMSHMAAAIADMTAQNPTVTAAQLTDILNAGSVLAYPLPTATLGQRIVSMSANSAGAISVDWSTTRNYAGAPAPSVPAGYLAPNESAIIADVRYDYGTVFGLILPPVLRFERHAYLRPRLSGKVVLQ